MKDQKSYVGATNCFIYAIINICRPGENMIPEKQSLLIEAFSDFLMDLILTSSSEKFVSQIATQLVQNPYRLLINSVQAKPRLVGSTIGKDVTVLGIH